MKNFILVIVGILIVNLISCRTIESRRPIADIDDIISHEGEVEMINACWDMQEKSLIAKPTYPTSPRLDCTNLPSHIKDLTKSIIALVDKDNLVMGEDGYYKIKYPSTYRNAYQLCEGEEFADQPILSFCSGAVAGEATQQNGIKVSVVQTAGHCLKTQGDCENTLFIQGFTKQGNRQPYQYKFSPNQIFKCNQLVRQKLDDFTVEDYAMATADRIIPAASIKYDGRIPKLGDNIFLCGMPSGLPMKCAFNGSIISQTEHYYTTEISAYAGNSGSAAFYTDSLSAAGILVRGHGDFEWVDSGKSTKRKYAAFNEKGYEWVREKGVQCRRELQMDNTIIGGEHLNKLDFIEEFFPGLIVR